MPERLDFFLRQNAFEQKHVCELGHSSVRSRSRHRRCSKDGAIVFVHAESPFGSSIA